MDHAKDAFVWITTVLEQSKIPYRVTGGLAAQAHGVKRKLYDIDIEVRELDMPRIAEQVKPYLVAGPAKHKDDHWDQTFIELRYAGQEIDIASASIKMFNQQTGQWEELAEDLDHHTILNIFGKPVPVEPLDSLIEYKSKLARKVDLEDIRQLKQSGSER